MANPIFKILLFLAVSGCLSCKKNYTCTCSTLISTRLPLGNMETYHVKEKNDRDALINCSTRYDASGKATGGIYCDIEQD